LLPLALFVAPPQMPATGIEAPTLAPAPGIGVADIQTNVPPPTAAGSDAATPAGDVPPELADPLLDPARQPKLGTQPKANHHYPGDPLEGFNRTMFRIQLGLDKSIYGPLAKGYQQVLPKPVRGCNSSQPSQSRSYSRTTCPAEA
jgi:phospholipid-binding lipoprotein MlaA